MKILMLHWRNIENFLTPFNGGDTVMINLMKVVLWSMMAVLLVWVVGILMDKKEASPESLMSRIRKSGF
ncbi:MAG: hypothetical protein N2053_08065 [Chitinispirillaceae bacterium]|nr:hypothetical protein [Chitinispirillaceae bacterium]